MKKLGIFLIVVGVVLLIFAGYGFISASNSSYDVNMLLSFSNSFGITRQMSLADQIVLQTVNNRVLLLILSIACFAIGGFMIVSGKNKDKMKREMEELSAQIHHQSRQNTTWICPKCEAKNPDGCGKCQSCSTPKP